MFTEQTRLRMAEDVSHQSLGPDQETVILSLGSGYLYTCNETTAEFLSAVDGRRTLGEVVDCLLQKYDVARERLAADVLAMAEKLVEEGLLVVAE